MATSPFLWGSGGAKLTPEEIALQRSVLARRKAQGVDVSPIASPLQGLARVVDALGDRYQEGQLNASAADNAKVNQDILTSLLGGGSTASSTPTNGVAQALAPSTASVATASIPQTADAATIKQGLIARGIPEHIADGFLVNFQDESGLNPGINEAKPLIPGSRGGFGLYQLTGPRRTAYEAFASQRGVDPANVDAQLDWLKYELDGPEKKAAESIYAAGDTASAAQAIVNNFLRPSPEYRERRAASYANLTGSPVASTSGPTIRQAGTVASPQVAQTQSIAPTNALGVSPAIIQALTSPYANEQTQGVAKLLMQRQQSQAEQQQKLALAEQQRQQEIARRQAIAQQAGIDPAYAADDDIWKAAAGNIFAAPSTSTVGANVIDNRTGKPIYQGTPEAPTSVREFEYGQQNPAYFDQQERLRRSGASMTEGTIPTGYQAVRDENQRIVRYEPISGGPADTSKKEGLAKANTERSGNIVLEDVDRAVSAIESNPSLTTGLIGNWTKGISGTPANKVQNLLQTVRANSAFDRLQQMREASPTGGALGAVSDSELGLLQNAIGSLEQSNDSEDLTYNLKRVQGIYEDIIYGKDEAKRLREERKKASAGPAKSGARLKFNPATGELE